MLKKYIVDLMSDNPLNGISTYKDTLNLATGTVSRAIKKLVLTGEENWIRFSTTDDFYFYPGSSMMQKSILIATHYTYATSRTAAINNSVFTNTGGGENIWIRSTAFQGDVAALKTYLRQQYNNGTPVTVWYVLATAESSSITVPTGLTGTIKGYTTQSGTPTPTAPIYPTANTVTLWANYTPQKYNGTAWQTATGQLKQYNGSWS